MFKRTIAAIMILVAMLCLAVKVDAAKPDKWLIYWYVCGTDIETTRIAFSKGTDLMSDDPNALILAEPDRNPGDATRCIQEVEAAELSPDMKIFMQAGGTYIWGHKNFRDLNAKIQTKAVVYNKVGEDEFQPIQGTVLTGMNVNVRQWFLDKNEVLGCVGKLKMANKSGKKNEIQETNIELVESDCDVTKFFNALEKAFDNVTLFVKLSIEIMFYDSITW